MVLSNLNICYRSQNYQNATLSCIKVSMSASSSTFSDYFIILVLFTKLCTEK